jgi:Glyoxalase-like domain
VVAIPACDDLESESARLVALGARVFPIERPQRNWVTLADPEGNEFCLST